MLTMVIVAVVMVMVRRGPFFVSIISVGSNYDDDGIKNKRPACLPNSSSKQQHARVASSVHGGSITQHVRSKHSSNSRNTNHYGSKKNNSGSHDSNSLLKTRGSVTHQSRRGIISSAILVILHLRLQRSLLHIVVATLIHNIINAMAERWKSLTWMNSIQIMILMV
jgi:hypothetical protein